LLTTQKFIETSDNPNLPKVLSQLNVLLWHYAILIQGGHRIYSLEIHGPYKLNKGRILIVREYSRLKPVEVWRFASEFPYNEITIYEVYQNMEMKIDTLGHYWTSTYPSEKLIKAAITIDGRNITNLTEVTEVYKKCYKTFKKGIAYTKNYKREDWIRKNIELAYFWLKPLKDLLGEEWKPQTEILNIAYDTEEAKKAKESVKQYYLLTKNAIINLPKDKAVEEIANMYLKTIYQEW